MAELTQPAEGIVLAHFIVSDDVERSRRFYTEVLGGRVVFSGEVTYVALANSFIIINVGGGPTDDKPDGHSRDATRPQPGQQLPQYPGRRHPRRVRRMERPGCAVPDAAEAAPVRDSLLHPRSRRSSDRGGANHRPRGGLVGVVAVSLGAMKMAMVDASSCSRPAAVHPFSPGSTEMNLRPRS